MRFRAPSLWSPCSFLVFCSIAASSEKHALSDKSLPALYSTEGPKLLRTLEPTATTSPSHRSSRPLQSPTTNSLLQASIHDLYDLHNTLATTQDQYFSLWVGKWTTAIDWTAAVLGTHLTATLSTLSAYLSSAGSDRSDVDNEINKYFGQSTASYYGEEAFAIRMQAYDDMLWVVLEWLESIKFIRSHSSRHHILDAKGGEWHGKQFTPSFAHRARIFYELAEQGWDTRLCGGGMTWNPRLLPYKNAITNQLYISASIGMYLHFPGDQNCSPFSSANENFTAILEHLRSEKRGDCDAGSRGRYGTVFRQNAIDGYNWLRNSGMTNDKGLYTDGFHIRDYAKNKSATSCDERNEMVYTYNQGVILSGLRGLWEATGNVTYLAHGHQLVNSVAHATGWYESGNGEHDENDSGTDNKWHGLGADGILTELCDPSGSCNQDGQTFKGIFFHHLSAFCEPLPRTAVKPGKTFAATEEWASKHRRNCNEYAKWVRHNAQAALRTRDAKGRFGSWWGAPFASHKFVSLSRKPDVVLPLDAVDYRNLQNLIFLVGIDPRNPHKRPSSSVISDFMVHRDRKYRQTKPATSGDLNDRGRGRTVETQGSGLAVVRAMYEFQQRRERTM